MLSIIVITKNESLHVAKSIESALLGARSVPEAEVLLVDSCSTDGTVEIASEFPIRILQLQPHWRHTPAAGRFIGFFQSKGEYIFFLDGDSLLCPGFLPRAIDELSKGRLLAAVVGRRRELYWENGKCVGEGEEVNHVGSQIKILDHAPGSAMYRRAALGAVGCFNPFLYASEEAELGERLRQKGYGIAALPVDMVIHNTTPRETLRTYFRRMKSQFHLGTGQVIRLRCAQGRLPVCWLRQEARALAVAALLVFGTLALAAGLLTGVWGLMWLWLAIVIAGMLLFMLKAGSILKPFKYAVVWTFQVYALARGCLLRPHEPGEYPTEATIIKGR